MRAMPKRSHSHGPSIMLTEVPTTKSAMTPAPDATSPANAATSKAEYSKPQGSKAHKVPNAKGAPRPQRAPQLRATPQTARAPVCNHTG